MKITFVQIGSFLAVRVNFPRIKNTQGRVVGIKQARSLGKHLFCLVKLWGGCEWWPRFFLCFLGMGFCRSLAWADNLV